MAKLEQSRVARDVSVSGSFLANAAENARRREGAVLRVSRVGNASLVAFPLAIVGASSMFSRPLRESCHSGTAFS